MVTLVNRAYATTSTTGTGSVTLGTPQPGFQSFAAAGVTNGQTVRYTIEDGTAWEIGTGVYSSTGPTLTRSPSESSDGGSAINLTGAAKVFVTAAGEDIQQPPSEGPFVDGDKTKLNSALQPNDNVSELTNDANYIGTLGTLTKSFFQGESASIALSTSVSPTAIVGATKEVSNTGVSSKGTWDVTATGVNYELYEQAPDTSLTVTGSWDIRSAAFLQSSSVLAGGEDPAALFFKPDGTKMYVVGDRDNRIYEYDLSTAWDVSTATLLQNFSLSAQESTPNGVFFKPDGTKMYIVGASGDDVNEYDLSTAWDISTTSFLQNFSVSAQETAPLGVFFKSDGLKMYIVGSAGDEVNEYDLGTAWDISTASFLQNFSVSAQETSPEDIFFKSDGTKMYILGDIGNDVLEYALSTAWDISTATYLQNFSVLAQDSEPHGLFFDPEGLRMYVSANLNDSVYQYDLDGVALLGSGSFSSSDIGKRISVPDGGTAVVRTTDGTLSILSVFGSSSYSSGSWSLNGVYVDATSGITLSGVDTGWDISIASFSQNFSVAAQVVTLNGLFFKPDGTKMYVVGDFNGGVNEYDLSTAWDISTASFLQDFIVSAQDSSPTGVFFKSDGLKMYITGTSSDAVNEYDLSTAWDVSTASFLQSFSVSAQDANPWGVFFKPDGTKMYIVGTSGVDVNEYDLSTAWDVSTASFLQNFSVSAQEAGPNGVFFKSDGLKMYIVGSSGDEVNEYDLSTAWDVSTASFLQNFSVSAQDTAPRAVFFKPDGTKMYVLGDTGNDVNEYDVGAFAVTTAQYLPAITSASGQIDSRAWTDINSMTADDVANDGEVYYAVSTDGRTTWSIASDSLGTRNIARNNSGTWQYNAASGWSVPTASFLQSFSVSAQEANPEGMFFKPDGTKMYITGDAGRDVNEYDLSTAWDVSTASFLQSFSVSAQEIDPRGVFFKPDGTKMYITGNVGDEVNEYDLSTAWDISTASFLQLFSVAAQDIAPNDLFFKSDGTKMYIVGGVGDDIIEYDLSTAWDISTASYLQNFSVAAQETSPEAVFFKPDGTKMYVLGTSTDAVNEYDLSTAWDISTASYLQNFSVSPQEAAAYGLFFKPDGTKMYITGVVSDAVHEYDLLPFTIAESWVAATTNNEFATVSEALTQSAANRMDTAQIDGVSDESHFTLGDTLDLAIIPYLAVSGTAPTSDGVAINYDFEGVNKGALLGTDYDYEVPSNSEVRITALAALNLKIRVV